MKAVLISIGLMVLNVVNAANNPCIIKEIEEKVQPNLEDYTFNEEQEDFVVVSFKVENSQIQIIEAMGSSEELIQILTSELEELNLEKTYPADDIYSFKFIFNKQ